MRRQTLRAAAGTPLWTAIAAISALPLVAEHPSQAQPKMKHAIDDMPDATLGKQGVTHKSLLKSDIDGASPSGTPSTRRAQSIPVITTRPQ
jgi:hypothetical protein